MYFRKSFTFCTLCEKIRNNLEKLSKYKKITLQSGNKLKSTGMAEKPRRRIKTHLKVKKKEEKKTVEECVWKAALFFPLFKSLRKSIWMHSNKYRSREKKMREKTTKENVIVLGIKPCLKRYTVIKISQTKQSNLWYFMADYTQLKFI